jgi:hypothetical protein
MAYNMTLCNIGLKKDLGAKKLHNINDNVQYIVVRPGMINDLAEKSVGIAVFSTVFWIIS